jgi:cation transport protein ChaC
MPWIFGYGSLVWKAGFPYSRKEIGYIKGFVRRFWHGSTDHRGTPEKPGRVVTLIDYDEWKRDFALIDPHPANGIVWGVCYFIEEHAKEDTFNYLDYREKNGYCLVKLPAVLQNGEEIEECFIYIAPVHDESFLGIADTSMIARQILESSGPSGANIEYLLNLCDALEGVHEHQDEHLLDLKKLVVELRQ